MKFHSIRAALCVILVVCVLIHSLDLTSGLWVKAPTIGTTNRRATRSPILQQETAAKVRAAPQEDTYQGGPHNSTSVIVASTTSNIVALLLNDTTIHVTTNAASIHHLHENASNASTLPESRPVMKTIRNTAVFSGDGLNNVSAQHSRQPNISNASSSLESEPIVIKEKPRTLIMGCVRDAAAWLQRFGKPGVFRRMFLELNVTRIIFFENDSVDNTVEIIKSWQAIEGMPPIHLEHRVNMTSVSREELLAQARTTLWELARNSTQDFDYVLSMDLDEVNSDLAHVNECMNLPGDWMGCCANSYTVMYDLFASRSYDDWIPGDYFSDRNKRNESEISYAFRHIDAYADPIPMKSCFNGAMLYDWNVLKHLDLKGYTGISDNARKIVCEHVPFHLSLLEQAPSHRFYIQPKMMNNGPSWARTKQFFKKRLTAEARNGWFAINYTDPYYRTLRRWRSYRPGSLRVA